MSDFTYKLPDNNKLKATAVAILKRDNLNCANFLNSTNIEFEDCGTSYYYDYSKNSRWDAHALIAKIYVSPSQLKQLEIYESSIYKAFRDIIPANNGFDFKEIKFIPSLNDDALDVELPFTSDENLSALLSDIDDSLSKNQPTLVLDRLHTFATKFLRNLCTKYTIDTTNDKGEQYPLHSLAGMLIKHYENVQAFQSEFSIIALKSSISLFEKYNSVRNNQSFAHDNSILNDIESSFAVRAMANVITFLDAFDKQFQGNKPFIF